MPVSAPEPLSTPASRPRLPVHSRARARTSATALLTVTVLAAACARQPISPETATGPGSSLAAQGTVTTRVGTTTTRKAPATTAPPATAPGTTAAGATTGTAKVFDVAADLAVEVKVGDTFELHVTNDADPAFTWKADIAGTQISATGLRTDPAAEAGQPTTLVGIYQAGAAGEAIVTFSQAKADGTPGKQWKVTITVV